MDDNQSWVQIRVSCAARDVDAVAGVMSMVDNGLMIEDNSDLDELIKHGMYGELVDESLLTNVVTKNKALPDDKKLDMLVALITLKYTQSNSVCFAYDGQAIGVGAGQQSRIHCTRLAAGKADNWFLRQTDKVLSLPLKAELSRPDRNNVIDLYLSEEESEYLLADGTWEQYFSVKPAPFTKEEKRAVLGAISGVSVASDAFFPFSDNLERARRSGVTYVVQPGGSVRDDEVIATADKYGMTMVFNGVRLFHH